MAFFDALAMDSPEGCAQFATNGRCTTRNCFRRHVPSYAGRRAVRHHRAAPHWNSLVCRNYWREGKCYNTECSYLHADVTDWSSWVSGQARISRDDSASLAEFLRLALLQVKTSPAEVLDLLSGTVKRRDEPIHPLDDALASLSEVEDVPDFTRSSNILQLLDLLTQSELVNSALTRQVALIFKVCSEEQLTELVRVEVEEILRSKQRRAELETGVGYSPLQIAELVLSYLESLLTHTNCYDPHIDKLIHQYLPALIKLCASSSACSQAEWRLAALTAQVSGTSLPNVNPPRHNNDFPDILRIQVAPTEAEMLCALAPFLPVAYPSNWQRHTDYHFRLLRYDMMASFAEGTREFLSTFRTWTGRSGDRYRVKGGNSDIFVYTSVILERVVPDREALCVRVSFAQLPGMSSAAARVEHWKNSKRLMNGSLLCVLSWREEKDKPRLIFATIARRKWEELAEESPSLCLAPISATDLQSCLMLPGSHALLLHSKGGYFEAYAPVLEALKRMWLRGPPLQLREQLVPRPPSEPAPIRQFPNGMGEDSVLDLSCLDLRPGLSPESARVAFRDSPLWSQRTLALLRQYTTLDSAQALALLNALCCRVALIQGPPGTGKTYLGVQIVRALLWNKITGAKSGNGPIVTVCYTNHALDQFLEGYGMIHLYFLTHFR